MNDHWQKHVKCDEQNTVTATYIIKQHNNMFLHIWTRKVEDNKIAIEHLDVITSSIENPRKAPSVSP